MILDSLRLSSNTYHEEHICGCKIQESSSYCHILFRNRLSELIDELCRRQTNSSLVTSSSTPSSSDASLTEDSICASCDEAFLKSAVDQVYVRASRGDASSIIGKSLLQANLQQVVESFSKTTTKTTTTTNPNAEGDDDDDNNDRLIEAQLKKASQILSSERESLAVDFEQFLDAQLRILEGKPFRIGIKEAGTYLNNAVDKELQHLRRRARIDWRPSAVIRQGRRCFDEIQNRVDGVKSKLEEKLTRVKKPLPSTADKAAAAAQVGLDFRPVIKCCCCCCCCC